MSWDPMPNHQVCKYSQHILAVQAPVHLNGQTFPRELVNDSKHAELAPISGAILNKVIRPDMVTSFWPQTDARSVMEPKTPSFGLFRRNTKALTPPDPRHAFVIHMPAVRSQQRRDALIAIASILTGEADNICREPVFITQTFRLAPLCGAMLTDSPASTAFRDAALLADMSDKPAFA